MADIVLFMPRTGIYHKVLRPWMPLPLLNISAKLVQEGYDITIIDQRTDSDWKRSVVDALAKKPICFGISSMTGSQIMGGIEAAKVVRECGDTPIVWGGVHPSLFPKATVEDPHCDIAVVQEGEETFPALIHALESKRTDLETIPGLWVKGPDGEARGGVLRPFVDLNKLPDIPYQLIDFSRYLHRWFHEPYVVEFESSRGCPHFCTFCYNADFHDRKWRSLSPENTVSKLLQLKETYGVESFHCIDDDFFINLKRVEGIMRLLVQEDAGIRLGLQGIRIDTMERITDEQLELMVAGGARFLQFGVESGSQKVLDLMRKRIKVDQVIRVNQRLAKYPEIIAFYNFMAGIPGETREDVFMSTELAMRLLDDNPNAYISPFHIYKPYPGTDLYADVKKLGFHEPATLDGWGAYDWTDTAGLTEDSAFLRRVTAASYCIDKKIEMQGDSRLLGFMAKLYRPMARFRFRRNFFSMMPEARLVI
jgi:radical SAM superfamily enzyme YgiQ (UPF0313 family)